MNFFNIPILATAISIVICWGLFAIFCGLIQECMAQIKAERGRFMKNYLLSQLQDFPNGVNWASLLYMHGSIDLLSRAPEKPTNDIPPRLFAETLIEVVGKAHLVQMHAKDIISQIPYKNPVLSNFKLATMVLKPSDVASFFNQSFVSAELAATNVAGIVDESVLYKTLVQNIENWQSSFMDRLSLWYKKKVRVRLFMLGCILGLVLNIDSIQLFQIFNSSPDSRKAIIDNYVKNSKRYEALSHRLDSLQSIQPQSPAVSSGIQANINHIVASADSVKTFMISMNALGQSADLPFGTQYNIFTNWGKEDSFSFILLKVLGVLISGFAVSFGSPFWFDLLKKIFSVKV